MKVCLPLICLFFLTALMDGDAVRTVIGNEGQNITVGCNFWFTGSTKFFCMKKCEEKNILIKTTEARAESGRYTIEYKNHGIGSVVLYVSIRDLNLSDAGRYQCALNDPHVRHDDFDLVVTEATTTSDPNSTPETFTFLLSTSVTTTAASLTQSLSSYSSTITQQIRTTVEPKGQTDPLLYVGLSLAVLIILLATVLLIHCQKKKFHQQKGPPVKKDPADFTTINTVYEEIREENRENKPPAGEISSVYVSVQPNKPNAAESNEIYSLASEPQGQAKAEDIEYSEVQLMNDATRSSGGHLAASDNVTYSEPR